MKKKHPVTYLPVKVHSTRLTIVTKIFGFRIQIRNFQAINMKGSGAAFTADESATFGANEAPARVDVMNDLFLLGRCVMFRADNLAGCYL